MKKRIAILAATMALTALTAIPAYAGQWKQDAKGWWWQEDDGYYPTLDWRWIDGNHDDVYECYRFNREGYDILR